jgi:sugar lactone lactonase YvrE
MDAIIACKEGKKRMRSDHSKDRGEAGRPVREAFNDAQRARPADVFVQLDGRYVVRGSRGREHIFEPDGELVTSFVRPKQAHARKIQRGERRPITESEFAHFQEIFL